MSYFQMPDHLLYFDDFMLYSWHAAWKEVYANWTEVLRANLEHVCAQILLILSGGLFLEKGLGTHFQDCREKFLWTPKKFEIF